MKNFRSTLIAFLIVVIIILLIYLYNMPQDKTPVPYSQWSDSEKVEYLEEQISDYEDKIDELNSKLDNLKEDYDYDEELIEILQQQLLRHGIEPEEL